MKSGPTIRLSTHSSESSDQGYRRAEELYRIRSAEQDSDGYILCPVLPLRDIVLFPNMVTPLFLTSEASLRAVESAVQASQTVIAVAQLDPNIEDPVPADLYRIGTEIAVSAPVQLPDGSTSILSQGRRRVEVLEFLTDRPFLQARALPVEEGQTESKELSALTRAALTLFERCVELNRSLPEEVFAYATEIDDPGWLADLISSALSLTVPERQELLEIFDPTQRLHKLNAFLGRELELLELEDRIHAQVQSEMDRSQREMYLREQMKAIQTELGEGDLWNREINDLREQVESVEFPEEVESRALKELQRMTSLPPLSPEVGIIRTYLDWLIELPWSEQTEDNLDIQHVSQVLDQHHHGLTKAKDRILEYIAVRSLVRDKQKQPILCFVGPPGTGKTSLGRSIAEALGREFVRISLGGVRDEAELRGHRRTYVGALPGRVLHGMRRAGTVNPLFMLDEIDKLGVDYRGDPSAALLEVLDPEQNHAFSDHYLELPYDLSQVMFITTANSNDPIPDALLDRMELIDFPGYIEEEKVVIAKQFLIPRQLEQNGVSPEELGISQAALQQVIREYTWEAGVRNLERELGKLARKMARRKAAGGPIPKLITTSMLAGLLGPPEIISREPESEDQIGTATSLAWTENGGDTVAVEVLITDGKGNVQLTGQMGDVMQESAQAALSYVKSRSSDLGIDSEIFESSDLHVHIPEGAIPKDGPSAGITIATALASALTERPVKRDVGLSGEITLRGRVLPVGGVREKVLAAYRIKLSTVVLPNKNEKDLEDIPAKARRAVAIRFVRHMDEVLDIALAPSFKPKAASRQPRTARREVKRPSSSASPPA